MTYYGYSLGVYRVLSCLTSRPLPCPGLCDHPQVLPKLSHLISNCQVFQIPFLVSPARSGPFCPSLYSNVTRVMIEHMILPRYGAVGHLATSRPFQLPRRGCESERQGRTKRGITCAGLGTRHASARHFSRLVDSSTSNTSIKSFA